MSWENIVKFERNPYSDGKSYVRQIERIAEDIEKVIEYLNLATFFPMEEKDIETAIKMLKDINTEV